MRFAIRFCLLLGLLGGSLCAETTEQLLARQAAAWDAAICRKDEPAIRANLGEGFRHVDHRGEVSLREPFVAGLLDPALTIDPYTVENLDIRVQGETALVTGETHMTGTYEGKPFKSHYRYIDVYQRGPAGWAVVYIQITKFKG